ncbi:Fur family iron response transcriptional regulator [Thiogranum longum]|uniref:Ferric uptake regulation protein n=1 Tax=Thiogranum longum TaxID=1537524 RepID=A0A4V2PH26_9GAMM|nr:Fur family iron response transcriptional regulator [Thiogranum longum]
MDTSTPPQLLDKSTATERLMAVGIQPTRQRVHIAQVLLTGNQHLSADQVLEQMKHTGKPVSKATVYNTLGLFAARGLLREVIIDPTRVFYDTNSTPHHHMYNTATGELSDIDSQYILTEQLPELPEDTELEGVDVVIRVRPVR